MRQQTFQLEKDFKKEDFFIKYQL